METVVEHKGDEVEAEVVTVVHQEALVLPAVADEFISSTAVTAQPFKRSYQWTVRYPNLDVPVSLSGLPEPLLTRNNGQQLAVVLGLRSSDTESEVSFVVRDKMEQTLAVDAASQFSDVVCRFYVCDLSGRILMAVPRYDVHLDHEIACGVPNDVLVRDAPCGLIFRLVLEGTHWDAVHERLGEIRGA